MQIRIRYLRRSRLQFEKFRFRVSIRLHGQIERSFITHAHSDIIQTEHQKRLNESHPKIRTPVYVTLYMVQGQ